MTERESEKALVSSQTLNSEPMTDLDSKDKIDKTSKLIEET